MLFNICQICLSYESGPSRELRRHAKYTDVADELAEVLRSDKTVSSLTLSLLDVFIKRKAQNETVSSSIAIISHITIPWYLCKSAQRRTAYRDASMHFLRSPWRAVVNFSDIKRASMIILRWSIQFTRNISPAGGFQRGETSGVICINPLKRLRWNGIYVEQELQLYLCLTRVIYTSRDFISWVAALFDIYLSSQYFSSTVSILWW